MLNEPLFVLKRIQSTLTINLVPLVHHTGAMEERRAGGKSANSAHKFPVLRRLAAPVSLLTLVLLLAAMAAPSSAAAAALSEAEQRLTAWAALERPAQQFRRTRRELSNFASRCSWMADDWQRAVVSRHASLDRVIVFDARHGRWSGVGDSLLMWMSLMRFSRATGRAGFLFADPCADPSAPPRRWASHKTTDDCAFDPGAYFHGVGPGVDWQWSEATRHRVELRHGPQKGAELVLGSLCVSETGGRCRLTFANGTAALDFEMNDSRHGPKTKEDELAWFRCAAAPNEHTHAHTLPTPQPPFSHPAHMTFPTPLLRYFNEDLADVPWIRVELMSNLDFHQVAQNHDVCRAAGAAVEPGGIDPVRFCFSSFLLSDH